MNSTTESSKLTPTMSSIMVFPVGISPAVKNTGGLSLFFNAIPTIEWSRAVPYLEVNVQVARSPLSDDKRLNSPGLLKFIMGGAKIEPNTANNSIAETSRQSLDGTVDSEKALSTMGMEAFLMPQTLTPMGPTGLYTEMNSPTLRPTDVIDPFRPLLSVQSMNVSVVNSAGIGSYKNAKLTLVVHDRSRLSEVADFIKPDLYSTTELMIEYGWIHPEEDYTVNVWGALINMLRVREKFGVTNSSFNMEEGGQVTITLDLHMKGGIEYSMTKVTEDPEITANTNKMQELQLEISQLLESASKQFKDGTFPAKSVFTSQIFDAASSTTGEINLTKISKQVKSAADRLKSINTDVSNAIAGALNQLYGEQGPALRLQRSLNEAITKKMNILDGKDKKTGQKIPAALADPYLDVSVQKVKKGELDTKFQKVSNTISFGKLFMMFAAQPLLNTGKFDDIQILFYTSNSSAGLMRHKNIASFPIPREQFITEYKKSAMEKRSPHMTVREFTSLMSQYFFDNTASEGYGLQDWYQFKDGEISLKKAKRTGKDAEAKANKEIEKKLAEMGIKDGVFKPIQLSLVMEALPEQQPPGSEGQQSEKFESKTILRIHVFDKTATAYTSQSELINAAKNEQLGLLTFGANNTDEKDQETIDREAAKVIVDAEQKGLIQPVENAETLTVAGVDGPIYRNYKLSGGHKAIKEFVMSTVPYLIYGNQNTAVESLGLSSMQIPELSTVNILRSNRSGYITPEGQGKGGVPLKTIPIQLSTTVIGCPILAFSQQIFVDAGTGTDIDNIYAITGLEHNIEPGSFKSTLTMTPMQAYGKYESAMNKLEQQLAAISSITSTTPQ